ncbi:MAG: PAS domain S-box protein [Pyrinomonadaceae bacterium]|nr:PAS domain S-box protein [Pyrinomonadaceae bacterium]
MSQPKDQAEHSAKAFRQKLWWLIGGRLAVALLLLVAGLLWAQDAWTNGVPAGSLSGTMPCLATVIVLSLIYAALLGFSPVSPQLQVGPQFFFDVPLTTWLIWATGDVHSPYVALHIVIISLASIYFGARGALVTSVGCAASYTCAMLLVALGWVPDNEGINAQSLSVQVIQTIGFNDIAFFIVGLLAARLARRQQTDVKLIAATHELVNLRALHERIVESIRSGVVTTDLDKRICTFNSAAEEITGYRAGEVRWQHVSLLFGDITDKIKTSVRAAEEGETSPRFEVDSITAGDLRIHLGFSIFPLFAEGGETTGLVITFQDLTDIRALEETSRRQDRLAAVGRVAAGIAHEIRNPLASMRGSIQVLRGEMNGNGAHAELMEIVLRESDRLNSIITDFLTYARPRAITLAEVDLREALHETFTLLRHSPEIRAGHLLEEDVPDDPIYALVDAEQLRQVFWNLARNALQAMPDGGRLHAQLRPIAYGRLRIVFTDTGHGMTPEQVERLFEPFTSSTTGGTGLGLSIVFQIVRDHGGTIIARSREGHGTTVTIELPGARSQEPEVGSQNGQGAG